MPASTAPRLLEGEARGALQRARSIAIDELIEIIERSGLRGRGGAGYPFAEKLRAVRRNAQGGEAYLVANGYDADPGSPLARTLLTRNGANVVRGEGAPQRPPYPAAQGLRLRPTLVSSVETLAWLPLVVEEQVRANTKLVSVTGAVTRPGVYEVVLGTQLGEILSGAGGATGKLKGIHVGGPTGGILGTSRLDTRLDFDDLRVAGTHMGSAQVRAIAAGTCIVNEAATLFAYLARENCAICVPCRVGTKRVQAILESTYSGLGRDSDMAWLDELGTHMERFSLCGFGITAPSILRTTMREFADDYRLHIQEKRCPEETCTL